MNKVFKIAILTILIVVSFVTISNAATKEELLNHITRTYTIAGEQIKISNSDYVKVERYFSKYPVDEQTADKIITKINEVVSLMNNEGISNPYKLKKEKKKELLNIAQDVAILTGATLTYNTKDKSVTVYRDGKLQDVIYLGSESSTFRATGNNNMLFIISSLTVVIALATVISYRKIRANAK